MKTAPTLATLAAALLALASQARADEAKRFDVATAPAALERSGFQETVDSRAKPQSTPIVIEILSVGYADETVAANGAPTASPSRPVKRR